MIVMEKKKDYWENGSLLGFHCPLFYLHRLVLVVAVSVQTKDTLQNL